MTALCVGAAGPVGAQDIGDLPRLGFEIDPHEGFVGDLVAGQVDVADVLAECAPGDASPEGWPLELGVRWFEVAGAVLAGPELPEGIPIYWFGGSTADLGGFDGSNIEDPHLRIFYQQFITFWFAIATDAEIRQTFFDATFVVTFVDPLTQDLLGDLGGFDPFTGEASIVVPVLDPRLYGVVAACMEPGDAEELVFEGGMDAALAASTAWLQENYPDLDDVPPIDLFGPGLEAWTAFVSQAAPTWLAELLEPRALGLDFYCIVEADGWCHPDLRELTLAELEALEEDGLLGELLGDDLPATPVGASPRFTG